MVVVEAARYALLIRVMVLEMITFGPWIAKDSVYVVAWAYFLIGLRDMYYSSPRI